MNRTTDWARVGRLLLDVAVAAACATAAVAIHLNGSEAVAANADPNTLSVLLTALSGAPLVFRRRYPLAVLAVVSVALLGLVVTREAVGVSTIGLMVAFYTAVAHGTRTVARRALAILGVAVVATAALRPVDLSVEGAVVTTAALVFAWVLADGGRQRRDRHAADLAVERERAGRVVVEERLRITRELHDVVGHALSVMVVQAEVADRLLGQDDAQARTAIREISAAGRGSLTEMRRLLGLIRDGDGAGGPPREPLPGLDDLPGLVDRMEKAGLRVDLVGAGSGRDAPSGVQLAAYRVVQEALTNTLRHAGATDVRVALACRAGALSVEVTDDGPTGDVVPTATGPGHGLEGMRERVGMYGGELSVGPSGPGFRVHATFALAAPT